MIGIRRYISESVARRETGKYDINKQYEGLVKTMDENLAKCGFAEGETDGLHYEKNDMGIMANYDIYFKKWERGKHDIVIEITFQRPKDEGSDEWCLYMKMISDGIRLYQPKLSDAHTEAVLGRRISKVDYSTIKKFLDGFRSMRSFIFEFEKASMSKRKTPQTWEKLVEYINIIFSLNDNGMIK
jgi:hypothetical protein